MADVLLIILTGLYLHYLTENLIVLSDVTVLTHEEIKIKNLKRTNRQKSKFFCYGICIPPFHNTPLRPESLYPMTIPLGRSLPEELLKNDSEKEKGIVKRETKDKQNKTDDENKYFIVKQPSRIPILKLKNLSGKDANPKIKVFVT